MRKSFHFVALSLATLSLFAAACSSDDSGSGSDDDDGASGSGGSAAGGSGGASGSTATGGSATGGSATGGSATGGSATGGSATGGASGTSATGGSATGGTGASSPGCASSCARVVGAACGTTTQEECVAGCNALTTSCPDAIGPYNDCVSNPANAITCDAATMTAGIAGCDDEVRELSVCGICLPDSADMACGTCTRGSCCEALQTYARAADVETFDACVTPCADTACVDACAAASPIAGAAYAAVGDCQIGSCGEECVCQASDDDTECTTCLKAGCCAELVPYSTAPNVAEFAACIEPCTAQACLDDCVAEFPEAGEAYVTVIGCAQDACLVECG